MAKKIEPFTGPFMGEYHTLEEFLKVIGNQAKSGFSTMQTYERMGMECLRAAKIVANVVQMLREAEEHLDYCGYGDNYERKLARETKLKERIFLALEAIEVPVVDAPKKKA